MLVVPFAHDQPDNAERLRRLGVARTIPVPRYSAARATAELRHLLDDPSYAHRASEVGQQMRQEDGVRVACDALEGMIHERRMLPMIGHEAIQGRNVILRPATTEDEPQILEWLLRSDITPSILGPPLFPERPVPQLDDPSQRLDPHVLDGTAPKLGRCFLVLVDGEPAGQVTYNDIKEREGRRQVELDIWMRSESVCGKGYGTDTLEALCGYLRKSFGVEQFMVQPSARNPRAIKVYEKVGFRRLNLPIEAARELWGPNDYYDSCIWSERTHEPQAGNLPRTAPIWTAVPSSRAAPSMVAEVSPTSTLC